MTLIALSASLYAVDSEGVASSSIYVLYYFGIGAVGLLGGWVLQRFTAISIGVVGALVNSAIVFYLSLFNTVYPIVGLPCVFVIFLMSGIDHPNSLRFFNEVISEDKKMSFFSTKESATYLFNLIAPPVAAFIIAIWGARICFLIDGFTYLLSCLPWILLRKHTQTSQPPESRPDWFVGFKFLVQNKNILQLNISRLLNNLSYVTWIAALPLLIAKLAQGNVEKFAKEQALSTSLVSVGFLAASTMGIWYNKNRHAMVPMVWGASLFGLGAVIFLVLSLFIREFLYLGALLTGIGTYCFRISGMTLGQAFTPKHVLGAVIIAGDAVVRSWSFLVSLVAMGIFQFHESFELSDAELCFLLIIFPALSLISPFLLNNLVKAFVVKDKQPSQEMVNL